MILYIFQCHFPKSSHPFPLPQSPKDCSIHLCLFWCLAYRVIVTIFLNSIYVLVYYIGVFTGADYTECFILMVIMTSHQHFLNIMIFSPSKIKMQTQNKACNLFDRQIFLVAPLRGNHCKIASTERLNSIIQTVHIERRETWHLTNNIYAIIKKKKSLNVSIVKVISKHRKI